MDLQLALDQRAKVEEFTRKHRIGLLTLLFTDIVGSTELKQKLGELNAIPLLIWYREVIRKTLLRFKEAEEIETAGDSFFIVFAKPSEAVKFALLVQATLRVAARQTGRRILNRIGIHVGEVFIEEQEGSGRTRDLFGLQVDACARVMGMGKADQILMTQFAFHNARQVLRGQEFEGVGPLSWLSHGSYQLKGLEESVEICEVGEEGQAVLEPPRDSESARRFVDPEAELVMGWRPAVGQEIPGTSWVLEEKLGEGGFGEAWLTRHPTLKERRVCKFCFRADRVRSLKREVTLFRVLKERSGERTNIVRVYDVYLDHAPYYLVMEYLEGRDLRTWCQAQGGVGNIPWATRLEIVAQVAEALQTAHEAGVIHRDIKPSNILIGQRAELYQPHGEGVPQRAPHPERRALGVPLQVKLTDFGIGQVVSEEVLLGLTRLGFTQTVLPGTRGTPAGTYQYMAPELFGGKPASKQSDIYSLGVVLYQLLVGDFSRPITTDWAKDIAEPLLREDLASCTANNVQERFASAEQLAKNLRSLDQRQIARETKKAHELFEADQAASALAHLAKVLRRDPTNLFAANRIISALSQRNFGLPFIDLHEESPELEGTSRLVLRFPAQPHLSPAQFSPDNLRVLAVSRKTASIWDARTGRLLTGPLQHDALLSFVQFSPDGRRLLTVSDDDTVRVFDANTGQPLSKQLQHDGPVCSAQFSPEGERVLTACQQRVKGGSTYGTARIWDASTGRPLIDPIKHYPHLLESAQFSPDGERFLTISSGIRFWDARTGRPLNVRFETETKRPPHARFAQFTPDGQRLLTASFQDAQVWDLNTGKLLNQPPSAQTYIKFAQLSPDELRILTVCTDHTAQIWDAVSGRPLSETMRHDSHITAAQYSSDGERVLTASLDQTARVWDARTGRPLSEPLLHEGPVLSAQFSVNGRRVLTTSVNAVLIWEVRPSPPLIAPHFRTLATHWVLSPDGRRMLGVFSSGALIYDTQVGQALTDPLRHSGEINAAQFSPDGEKVVTASSDKTARVWNARNGHPLSKPLKHVDIVADAQFSPDGKRIVTVCLDKKARIWNADTGQELTEPLKHDHRISFAQFSPDGLRLLTAPSAMRNASSPWFRETGLMAEAGPEIRQVVQIFDAQTGHELTELNQPEGRIGSAEFSPDGLRVLTSSFNGVRIWDTLSGRPFANAFGSKPGYQFAQFSPDGEMVLAVSSHEALVWNALTGGPLTQPIDAKGPGPISSARLSPDGKRLVIALLNLGRLAPSGDIRVYDIGVGLPLTEPLKLASELVISAVFSPDGAEVLAFSGGLKRWELPCAILPIPDWLPRLAEAVGGFRLNAQGERETIPSKEVLNLRESLARNSAQNYYTRWAKWFFADESTRTISALSPTTLAEYVRRRFEEGNYQELDSLREGARFLPTSGLVLSRLAGAILSENPPPNSREVKEADWYSCRAIELTPDKASVWSARAAVLAHTDKLQEALEAMKRAIAIEPQNYALWNRNASILTKCNRLEEAYESLTRVIELTSTETFLGVRSRALIDRSDLLKRLDRPAEARADVLLAFSIPSRDPLGEANLIDLTPHYNYGGYEYILCPEIAEGNRANLPLGIQVIGGVRFDVRGMVTVGFDRESLTGTEISGIVVAQKCKHLHFLYTALSLPTADSVLQVAKFVAHFADGQTLNVPVVLGKDLAEQKNPSIEDTGFLMAQAATDSVGPMEAPGSMFKLATWPLFKGTWENPLPDVELTSLDLVSTLDDESAITTQYVIAITTE